MLKDILENKKNNKMINQLLTNVLKMEVKSLTNINILKFSNISEYQFSAIKAKCQINNNQEIEIYLRIIKKDKIKETIFCYWFLLYEEELKKQEIDTDLIINRVVITEMEKERYKNSLFLENMNNNNNILKYGTEVYFIDLIKYIEENKDKADELEKWKEYFEEDSDDLMLIGVKLNKDIRRNNINL